MAAYDPLEWRFVQSFGDDNSSDDDLVTAVEFDETGEFLAVGDKAGRICIFEGHESQLPAHIQVASRMQPLEYKFYTEFQSHEPEFDCLKSLEIEEKINMIKWSKRRGTGLFLLATNDKTIKFWRVHDKKMKRANQRNPRTNAGGPSSFITPILDPQSGIAIPKLTHSQTITTATPKRVYSNAHGYHINSISLNSDGETFISADDLRINLWNLDIPNESFNIIDMKPTNLDELNEVITCATFHPSHCNVLVYCSSRGSIRLADLRDSALCDHHSKLFEVDEDPANRSFFSEIISSISDARFVCRDGRYIVSRDYMTIKIWDVNMESQPVSVIPVHDYLKVHLCDLYENDCIFDKFECHANADGTRFVTGSYNNHFVLHSTEYQSQTTIEALRDGPRPKPQNVPRNRLLRGMARPADQNPPEPPNVNLMDFGKKALHVAWHPSANTVAVAGLNKLYIYQALNSPLVP